MRLTTLSISIVVLLASAPVLARDGIVLIRHARVFDGLMSLGMRDVLVEDGRITAVAKKLKVSSEIEVVDAWGRTLIPGVIDGHVHVFLGAQAHALRYGVTTVFDMYSIADRATIDHWRVQRSANGKTAGIGATPPGGHPTELFNDMPAGMALPPTLSSNADAYKFMKARVEAGSDYIKVLQDDGARPGRPASLPAFASQRFSAVISTAKATGKLVVVHVQQLADARIAIASGVNALEHAICDAQVDDPLIATMKMKGTAQNSTLATYDSFSRANDLHLLALHIEIISHLSPMQQGMLGLIWK